MGGVLWWVGAGDGSCGGWGQVMGVVWWVGAGDGSCVVGGVR